MRQIRMRPRSLWIGFLLSSFTYLAEGKVIFVSSDGDGSDGHTWPTAFSSISEALVSAVDRDKIWVAEGLYHEALRPQVGVNLFGGFTGTEAESEFHLRDWNSHPTIVDATGTDRSVFSIQNNDGITIDGFSITGGSPPHGGGILVEDSSATVRNCVIHGNIADDQSAPLGGGVYVTRSNLLVVSCTVRDNKGFRGLGMSIQDATACIRDCTISHNSGIDLVGGQSGGGISSERSNLHLERSTLSNNGFVGNGGGLLSSQTKAEIRDCTFTGNIASDGGGGIYTVSNPQVVNIVNCLFQENRGTGNFGGGGVYGEGNTSIQNCRFINNLASYGGGVAFELSNNVLADCYFSGNKATKAGGGLDNVTFFAHAGHFTRIESCVFVNNEALGGGAIFDLGEYHLYSDCVIKGNRAIGTSRDIISGGGGIHAQSPTQLTRCVIADNYSRYDGGGGVWFLAPSVLENCLVFRNRSDAEGGGCLTTGDSIFRNCTFNANQSPAGNDLVASRQGKAHVVNCIIRNASPESLVVAGEGEAFVTFSNVSGGWVGEGNIDTDPLFVDSNGRDFRLSGHSPCIDAGALEGPTVDLDGEMRPVDVAGIGRDGTDTYDMGAYEFQNPFLNPGSDINGDDRVDAKDLLILLADWKKVSGP